MLDDLYAIKMKLVALTKHPDSALTSRAAPLQALDTRNKSTNNYLSLGMSE